MEWRNQLLCKEIAVCIDPSLIKDGLPTLFSKKPLYIPQLFDRQQIGNGKYLKRKRTDER
jgi:hypothetical protein